MLSLIRRHGGADAEPDRGVCAHFRAGLFFVRRRGDGDAHCGGGLPDHIAAHLSGGACAAHADPSFYLQLCAAGGGKRTLD